MADTRGLQRDELHKRSIATQNKQHIDIIAAVLILVNDAVPRVTAGTDSALSNLFAAFPNSLASSTAFMFTNVSSPLHWNFSGDTIPNSPKDAPYFLLSNPIALQKEYLKLKDDPNMKKTRADLCNAVKASEENAMGMLVKLFDWLDGLEPQATMGMTFLHGVPQRIEGTIANASGTIGQVAANTGNEPVSLHIAYAVCFQLNLVE